MGPGARGRARERLSHGAPRAQGPTSSSQEPGSRERGSGAPRPVERRDGNAGVHARGDRDDKVDESRPEKDAPEPRRVERLDEGGVVETPMVGGLHHRYTRQAA